ncbi:unnamed protein product [Didymodactylos carnosus]|uniref:Protein kinase domain-containing protein n=1 Tax=Didymodactylos carnosus TaxID=1234261 RepID=A0A816D8R8_9BILA|nr:unnamed protein product [Didymodactylos carnosus]CAF4527782.1 unnamed protein product [Didymodactylos carnosus]
MEYMSKGSLTKLLENKNDRLNYRKKLSLACNIVSGMRKIHEYKITHRDIRPDNIFVNENYVAKVGDMGVVKRTMPNELNMTHVYEPYMPLEYYTGLYDTKLDIFTFGLTLNELFTEVMHDKHSTSRQVIITKRSSIFWDLISACINNNPKIRPTALELEKKLYKFKAILTTSINRNRAYSTLTDDQKNQLLLTVYQQAHL